MLVDENLKPVTGVRKFEFRDVSYQDGGLVRTLSYRAQLIALASDGSVRPFQTDEMLLAAGLSARIASAGDSIELLPDEHAWLLQRLKTSALWTQANAINADFVRYLRALPIVEPLAEDAPGQPLDAPQQEKNSEG